LIKKRKAMKCQHNGCNEIGGEKPRRCEKRKKAHACCGSHGELKENLAGSSKKTNDASKSQPTYKAAAAS
jgi:hypothetical protein